MAEHPSPRFIQKLLAFGRWLAQRDQLPETGMPGTPTERRRSIVSWLTTSEPLPRVPPAPAKPHRRLTQLLAPEPLPQPPRGERSPSVSFFRWLFGRDTSLPRTPDTANKEAP